MSLSYVGEADTRLNTPSQASLCKLEILRQGMGVIGGTFPPNMTLLAVFTMMKSSQVWITHD